MLITLIIHQCNIIYSLTYYFNDVKYVGSTYAVCAPQYHPNFELIDLVGILELKKAFKKMR